MPLLKVNRLDIAERERLIGQRRHLGQHLAHKRAVVLERTQFVPARRRS